MSAEREYIQLRDFTEAELIFDEQETKEILKFFFQADRELIGSTQITNELRNFAQGLLVAAVDASYAMGWIELTFRWATNPGQGLKKALRKLASQAARYWFKHLKQDQSLADAKIYESVREQLARNFRSPFRIMLEAKAQGQQQQQLFVTCVNCSAPNQYDRLWG
ncbi:MAG: hypothetical protein LBV61_11235 [Burkholderiaceae bacterium]|jgi:hypothetical protein|nr:hypothetical protein [Burkholderiaceae bacterium]